MLGLPEPFLSDGLQDASSCAASMVWFRGCGDGVPRALALPPRFLCPRPHRTSPRGHLPEGEETTPRVPAESHVSHVLEFSVERRAESTESLQNNFQMPL